MASSSQICGVNNSLTFGSDPSAVNAINASAVYGGIRVIWQYPSSNAHSIAHFKLYRSNSNSSPAEYATLKSSSYFDSMDQGDTGNRFYYWVRWVSVNGTVGPMLGPASAVAGSRTADMLQLLSGQILSSHLAASLRTEIEDIPDLRNRLLNEETGRVLAIEGIENTLSSMGYDISQTFAAIDTERTTRISGMNVLASQIDVVAASNGQNLAAIITEQTARVSATESLTELIQTQGSSFQGEIGRVESAIQTSETTLATENTALAERIDTLVVNLGSQFGAIQNDQIVAIDEEGATVAAKETLQLSIIRPVQDRIDDEINPAIASADGKAGSALGAAGSADAKAADAQDTAERAEGKADGAHDRIDAVPQEINAAIDDYSVTRAGYCVLSNGDISAANNVGECDAVNGEWKSWLAIADDQKRLNLAIGDPGENEISMSQRMQIVEDETGKLQGKYTVKIQTTNDGQLLMGGFGIASQSIPSDNPLIAEKATDEIMFGVVADKFFIAHPYQNVLVPGTGQNGVPPEILPERLPFIVSDGNVYMNSAYIKDLSVDTLKIKGRSVTNSYNYKSYVVRTWQDGQGFPYSPVPFQSLMPNMDPGNDVKCVFTFDCAWYAQKKAGVAAQVWMIPVRVEIRYFDYAIAQWSDWEFLNCGYLNLDTQVQVCSGTSCSSLVKSIPSGSMVLFRYATNQQGLWTHPEHSIPEFESLTFFYSNMAIQYMFR